MNELALGIDLGTTNTVVAEAGRPLAPAGRMVPVPSALSYPPDSPILVGTAAVDRAIIDPENTVLSSKRVIGLPYSDGRRAELQPYFGPALARSRDGTYGLRTRAGLIDPVRAAAHVLAYSCERVRRRTTKVGRAVVTVPSGFDSRRRNATLAAARASGLREIGIVDEPIATAIAYLHRSGLRHALIYDLGGGTFDVAVIDCSEPPFRVCGHDGDTALGGDDIDLALASRVTERVLAQHGWDLASERITHRRLVRACEHAKRLLMREQTVPLDLSTIDAAAPELPAFELDQELLRSVAEPLVARTFAHCDRVLGDARMRTQDIEAIFLAGGSCRLQVVRDQVERYFGKRPRADIDPLHVVAIGASYAAIRPALSGLLDTPIRRRPQSRRDHRP